jgi:hypothetical protein
LAAPSLQELQQAKPAKLEKFLRAHHCLEIPGRLQQIRQAIPATYDRTLMDSAPLLVTAWVRQIHPTKGPCLPESLMVVLRHPDDT